VSASPWRVPVAPPRRVKISAYTGAEGLFCAIGLLGSAIGLAALAAFSFAGVRFWDDVILGIRGLPAIGAHVGNLPTDLTVKGRPVYEVRFRYRDKAGREHQASCRTHDEHLAIGLKGAANLGVHYDPSDPKRARIDGMRVSPYGYLALAPLLATAASIALAAMALRRILRRRWLYVWGQETLGRVTLVAPRHSRFGDEPIRTHYSFEAGGTEREGITEDSVAPPEGAAVPVLFDPRRPERNLLPRPGAFEV